MMLMGGLIWRADMTRTRAKVLSDVKRGKRTMLNLQDQLKSENKWRREHILVDFMLSELEESKDCDCEGDPTQLFSYLIIDYRPRYN